VSSALCENKDNLHATGSALDIFCRIINKIGLLLLALSSYYVGINT